MWSKFQNLFFAFKAQISRTGTGVPVGGVWAFHFTEATLVTVYQSEDDGVYVLPILFCRRIGVSRAREVKQGAKT